MDINRNAIRNKNKKESVSGKQRLTDLWGDDSWKDIAYKESRQIDLLKGEGELEKISNDELTKAFMERLEKKAKFKYVIGFAPMRNSKGAVIYYLIFATNHTAGRRVMSGMKKHKVG